HYPAPPVNRSTIVRQASGLHAFSNLIRQKSLRSMQPHSRSPRRTLLTIAKFALAIGILSYLVIQVQRNEGFTRLWEQEKNWPLLAAAVGCTFAAILLNFVRWHFLIRAVGIDIRLPLTMRYGALGYALNFVAPGSIGGDLFKAIFLAHGQPGRRT